MVDELVLRELIDTVINSLIRLDRPLANQGQLFPHAFVMSLNQIRSLYKAGLKKPNLALEKTSDAMQCVVLRAGLKTMEVRAT